jgi:probable F420-dependent oxidoreductase
MTKIELGPVGAVVNPGVPGWVEAVAELEALGYSTVWLTGGPLTDLDQVREAIRATSRVKIAPAILSVDRFDAAAVNALYTELESGHPGRFVVGLGGAHRGKPIATLNAYLDELTAVPPDARILAALGPKMLGLARDRSAGAYPVLVTPQWVTEARRLLGDGSTLALMQMAVLDTDAERARAVGRGPLGMLGAMPAYQQHFRRMGFTDEEFSPVGDRITDALVLHGDAATIAAGVRQQLDAGADHVGLLAIDQSPTVPLDAFRALAAELW